MRVVLTAIALLLAADTSQAANVFKCVDAKGKITFTAQANCPDNHSLDDVVTARNPTISSEGEETVMAQRRIYRSPNRTYYGAPPPSVAATDGVTVVGASRIRPDCDTGLNDQDLRTAKVRGEIVPGMTRGQVASVQGDDPRRSRGGAGTDVKVSHDYKTATAVSYDRNGCAGSVSTWQRR
ncbi:DUF4124 domain-containing protein [Pseudomonas sp. RIT411]|uniref:DUF4124 domain-containing protein n=1 Tax=Pseudomonas sp. RIT411 TaxID=2202160 RepID=UPI0013141EF7|nr:DUF4124 domain-containing protein [Pseudomonas sp. RIT 411]